MRSFSRSEIQQRQDPDRCVPTHTPESTHSFALPSRGLPGMEQQGPIINARRSSDSLLYLQRCITLTCQACDSLMHAASLTRPDGSSPLSIKQGGGSPTQHDALRELSLSLAAVETLLVDFCCELLQHAGEDPRPYVGGPASSLLAALTRLEQGSNRRGGTSHPLPPGGTVSLLYHLACCLEDTLECLHPLAHGTPTRMSIAQVGGRLWQWVRQSGRGQATRAMLAYAQRPVESVLIRLLLGRPLWESRTASLVRSTCELNTLIRLHVLTVHHLHRQALWAKGRRGRKGSAGAVDSPARLPTATSQPVLLMRRPTEHLLPHCPGQGRLLPIEALGPLTEAIGRAEEAAPYARRVLTATSMPRSASLWPTRSVANALLSRALDTYYASCAWSVGWERQGGWMAYLTVPIFLLAFVVYNLFPRTASDVTASLLAHPDPAFIARAWRATGKVGGVVGHVKRWCKRLPGRKAAIALAVDQSGILLAGIPCHVLSNVPVDLTALQAVHVEGHAWPKDRSEYQLPHTLHSPGGSDAFLSARGLSSSSSQGGAGRGGFPPTGTATGTGTPCDPIAQEESDSEQEESERNVGLPVSPPGQPARGGHSPSPLPPVILAIHGGGFIGRTGCDISSLAAWVQASATPVLIIQPHYSLSPEAKFPTALQEVMSIYSLVRSQSSAVVLLGESAGGMLAAAVCVWAISSGIPLPRAVAMVYPSLNLGLQASPSRALHMSDPLISYPVLHALAQAYLPEGTQLAERVRHPLLAPLHAPDSILQHFPPCYMLTGGLDPLLDDSCDMYQRLVQVGRQVELDIIRTAPHGFLAFPFLQGAQEGIQAIHRMLHHAVAHV